MFDSTLLAIIFCHRTLSDFCFDYFRSFMFYENTLQFCKKTFDIEIQKLDECRVSSGRLKSFDTLGIVEGV